MTSRAEAIAKAGQTLATARTVADAMAPRELAEAAHRAGGPSVDELEDRIRVRRGLPPIHQDAAAS